MPVPPNIEKLIVTYRKAKYKLVSDIQKLEAKGRITSYQKSLLTQVDMEIERLNKEAIKWTNEEVPKNYKKGVNKASVGNFEQFNKLHTAAIETLVTDTTDALVKANFFVGRAIQDNIRESVIDAIGQKLATGQTIKQAKQNILNNLVDEGVVVTTKNGRRINLDVYSELVARSTTREATNLGTMNQLRYSGYDLVQMSSHGATCPICGPLEGRVYSISGESKEYPTLDLAFGAGHANIHPNCRHVLVPYITNFKDKSEIEKDKEFSNRPIERDNRTQRSVEQYNKEQKKKRELNRDRRQWERYKTIMPEQTPKTLSAFRNMKRSDSDNWKELTSNYKSLRKKNI